LSIYTYRVTSSSFEVLEHIREQITACEAQGVEILCCPEGVLGRLADYTATPLDIFTPPSTNPCVPHTDQFITVDKDVRLEVLDWGGQPRNNGFRLVRIWNDALPQANNARAGFQRPTAAYNFLLPMNGTRYRTLSD
jgi:hypothetical protein